LNPSLPHYRQMFYHLSHQGRTNPREYQIVRTHTKKTTGLTLGGQKPKGRKNSTLKPGKKRPQAQ